MARGNQRIQSREKNIKDKSKEKSKNTMGGNEYQRVRDDMASIMREKQRKADERKAAEGTAGKKK